MSAQLVPCPSCNRHVFADACDCPFCQAKLSPDRCVKAQAFPVGYRRMSRAARLAAGAALLGAAACGSAAYGSPPPYDGGRDAPTDGVGTGPDGAAGTEGAGGKGGGGPGSGGVGGNSSSSGMGGGPGVTPLYGGTAPIPGKPVGQ